MTTLLADGQGTGATEAIEVIEVIEAAPPEQRALGRLRWAEARAAVLAGRLDRAGSIIHGGIVVADLREGELALEDLWFDYQAALRAATPGRPVDDELRAQVRATVPVPRDLDFRMSSLAACVADTDGSDG